MLTQEQINQLHLWWHLFKHDGDLVELRFFKGKKILSGYYRNIENILRDIDAYSDFNVYFTVNQVTDAAYGREQNEKAMVSEASTTDKDISRREWIFIDFDCERPKGTNATDEMKEQARRVSAKTYLWIVSHGISEPIVVDSGNGYHLYIPFDSQNDATADNLVKGFISALSVAFSTDGVKVDTAVFNAARIARLPGCYNRKGADTERQPQRLCRILKTPQTLAPTPASAISAIARQFEPAEEDKPSASPSRNYGYRRQEDFDLEAWCSHHGIAITGKRETQDGTRYYIEHCVFNPAHNGNQAVLFRYRNGAIAYKCLHDSCSSFGWRDVRLKYEPDAYDYGEKMDFEYRQLRKLDKQQLRKLDAPQRRQPDGTDEKGDMWLKLSNVALPAFDIKQYIPSGIEQIDSKICGFKRKHVSVWSGYRGCGKSSLLNMLVLNAADRGYNTALWTGELDSSEVKQWLYLQAAGRHYNKPASVRGFYYTPKEVCGRIDPWIDKHFRLFNNNYGSIYLQLEERLRELKRQWDMDVAIFDNLMTLDLEGIRGEKYQQQDGLMASLTLLAKELDIHIHIVAHPNKSGGFLRMNSVSGSGHITDLAQNVFILHRINKDFLANAGDFLGQDVAGAIVATGCTNAIEICKCRDKGSAVDTFINLYFEKESNRLKDTEWECVNYAWSPESNVQLTATALLDNISSITNHERLFDNNPTDVPY